jgi:DNA helicase-2/ATP-dependent DNA helicase PcrA
VTGLEEGLLPFYGAQSDAADVEEERRLLYVGMTRAERKLYLTYTQMRMRFGETSFSSPSRFLGELGEKSIEHKKAQSFPRVMPRMPEIARRGQAIPPRVRAKEDNDGFVADPMPDYESESQETVQVKKGAVVRHEVFGRGKVVDVTGKGEDRKAVVQFEEYGLKSLILRFARLKPG